MATKKKSKKSTKRKANGKRKQPERSYNPFVDVGKEMVDIAVGGAMITGISDTMPVMFDTFGNIGKR